MGFCGYGVWEDHPEEGYGAAGGYGGQFVWAEEVDWVVGLAVGLGGYNAQLADLDIFLVTIQLQRGRAYLELVADDDVECYDRDDRCTKVLRY